MLRYLVLLIIILNYYKLFSQEIGSVNYDSFTEEENYEKLIEDEEEKLVIIGKNLGENSVAYSNILGNLAQYYNLIGAFDKAVYYGEKESIIKKELFGDNSLIYADAISNLGIYHSNKGNYLDAIRLESIVLTIEKDLLGEDHPDYLSSLSNLMSYYAEIGDQYSAIKIGTRLLDFYENNRTEEDINLAIFFINLANCYSESGNYIEAISYGLRGKEIFKKFFGENHPYYGASLNNLASFYSDLGNTSETLKLAKEALNIKKETLGEKNPEYATALNNLALFYADIKDFQKALKLGNEAIKIQKEILGKDHPDYAMSLTNLAIFNSEIGNHEEAISLGEEAIEQYNNIYTDNNPFYAGALHNLAKCYWDAGCFNKARQNIEIAINIRLRILGKQHPDYTASLIAGINYNFNNLPYIIENSRIISENQLNEVLYNFTYVPLLNRTLLWEEKKSWFNYYLPYFTYFFNNEECLQQGYNASLLNKGILLNSEMEFDQFIVTIKDDNLLDKYNEIKTLRLQLNKLYEKPIAERYCDTDSLERHVNELERKLMDESSEYGDYTKNLSVTWEDVQKGLGKKDAAIEFVHFPLNQDSTMYMAYILRPEMESPAMVKLFEEKELKGLSEEKLYTGVEGSQLVWEKLQPKLEGIENVYFSPDGILHQIAIEYFPDYADSTKLISDRYRLNRLTSTRQIALKKDKGKTDKAIVYGGISYDTDPDIMETESRKYERGKTRGIETYYNVADSLSGLRSGVKYLQFTMKEAENVSGLLSSGHYNLMLRSGNEATEESFKSLSGTRPGIMHIATHGFYWEEEEADRQAQMNERLLFMSQFGENARRNVEDKALTRTGLFMAGANNALSGKEIPEDIDDGILTASEIANLDLRGTDLVVLSACQTGMGDIGGDGVFGLQRGLKKAGVNSILMSLWDVDDEATQILMTSFYQNYLKGMSKQEALLEAQRKVRETPGFEDPEFWAAFILLDALN